MPRTTNRAPLRRRAARLLALAAGCAWFVIGAAPSVLAQAELSPRLVTARPLGPDPWRIDGVLAPELAAGSPSSAGGVSNFLQFAPDPLAAASATTEVWVAYDDAALYVAARLHDPSPDSILAQLSERDRLRNTDWFAVSVNPYRDGINATNFAVTPANVQYDSKFNASFSGGSNQVIQSGDASWDGVWASAARIDGGGWTVEMRIPYSALRFPDEPVQTWDINFARQIRRRREESFWNPVDPKGPGAVTQMGTLAGIRDIAPPLRLQATPFVTAALSNRRDPGATPRDVWGSSVGGGLDLKYGLSDAFTLDMTAVPDFSNARSDDQVLNLGANEIRFDENRAFFTEGVELFNKGGFFYSRRVGGRPFLSGAASDGLGANERVAERPAQARLLNATKVSGRTQGGLGVGVFNAVEGRAFARVVDDSAGTSREVLVGPATNYSVVSLDQNLPNNSFVTLVNTNVLREGSAYDANLTGVVFDVRTASNAWSLNGRAAVSQQYGLLTASRDDGEIAVARRDVFGHTVNVGLERLTGRLRYGVEYVEESDDYDPNDLGFLFFNNSRNAQAFAEYNWFEPFGKFNSARVEAFGGLNFMYEPQVYASSFFGVSSRFTTRKFFTFGVNAFTDLTDNDEFQDARAPGRFYTLPAYAEGGAFVSSDYRRPLALDVRARYGRFHADGRSNTLGLRVSPRVRMGDKLTARLSGDLRQGNRYLGYVGHTPAGIARLPVTDAQATYIPLDAATVGFGGLADEAFVISYRTISTAELELSTEYSFTANATLNLRVRHYWSRVRHEEFAEVFDDGLPRPTPYAGLDAAGDPVHDRSFNAFNVDGFFRWRFAPGSDAFLSYKTQSFFDGPLVGGYGSNLRRLPDAALNNSLTLKVIYFLDAAELRRRRA